MSQIERVIDLPMGQIQVLTFPEGMSEEEANWICEFVSRFRDSVVPNLIMARCRVESVIMNKDGRGP
jgi:hypothetical protein